MITCALIIPTFVATKMIVAARAGEVEAANMSLMMLLAVGSLGCMVTASLLVFNFHISSLKSTAYSLMCILYCGILGSVGAHINHLATNSLVAVMLMFFITAGVDTFALLVGMSLGKVLPLKLAPHTSPNKTVVGAIGGILGGIIAASVAYGCCALIPGVELTFNGKLHPWVLLILISLPTSIFSQLGDLFESAIKRGCGIKDMGKILPGHGGILDRFDSMLFAAIPIIVCFVMIN
jgi:phosphatidate cytidylyltransferase